MADYLIMSADREAAEWKDGTNIVIVTGVRADL